MNDTIRADAPKIATAVSVFRASSDTTSTISWDGVAAGLDVALPGGSAVAAALDRACGASATGVARCVARTTALADFAQEAHRFLELADEEFAANLAKVTRP